MKLILFRHLWGVPGAWENVFPRFKERGYGGIEAPLPPSSEVPRFRRLLDKFHFDYIAQIFSEGKTPEEHLASFREQVGAARRLRPYLINAHSGRDAFSEDGSIRFFEGALAVERQSPIKIAHETHRGRILYNPWTASRLLARFADLKLCCDFSHWVCVCERLLADQSAILRQCAARCLHLHARVGYEQGPQVPDPRAPEYEPHLAEHEKWWRMVWRAQLRRGQKLSTLTPEFGPPHYLHTLPFTGVAVSDLEQICDWQARRQAAKFARCCRPGRSD